MTVENDWIESFLPYFDKDIIGVMGDNIPPPDIILNPIEKYYFGVKEAHVNLVMEIIYHSSICFMGML